MRKVPESYNCAFLLCFDVLGIIAIISLLYLIREFNKVTFDNITGAILAGKRYATVLTDQRVAKCDIRIFELVYTKELCR